PPPTPTTPPFPTRRSSDLFTPSTSPPTTGRWRIARTATPASCATHRPAPAAPSSNPARFQRSYKNILRTYIHAATVRGSPWWRHESPMISTRPVGLPEKRGPRDRWAGQQPPVADG